MPEEKQFRIILCGASAYDQKYYFNQQFSGLPGSIQDELHILCVLFTEEVGGVFTVGFTPRGEVDLSSEAEEGDLLYDEIGCGLMMKKIKREKEELFDSLSLYFRVKFLHEDASALLDEDEE